MTKYTDVLTARKLIQYIANDYVELSYDKIRWQRDDHMKICGDWLIANNDSSLEEKARALYCTI